MKMSKEKFIGEVINLELSTDTAIAKLSQQLHEHEEKYNLRSEIFYNARINIKIPSLYEVTRMENF